jgi:hypothetical protein
MLKILSLGRLPNPFQVDAMEDQETRGFSHFLSGKTNRLTVKDDVDYFLLPGWGNPLKTRGRA